MIVRRAVLTGASGAIAGALADELRRASPDATLVLVDRDEAGLRDAARRLGGPVELRPWDLARPVDEAEVTAALDGADLLVNAAGVMEVVSLVGADLATMERLLAIDLTSPLRLLHAAARTMSAAGEGTIVNVSSMAGVLPLRGCAYYGAAKAGLAMASEIARLELAPRGVHVLTVYPGPVRSGLEQRAREQFGRSLATKLMPTGDPRTLAKLVVEACRRRAPRVVYPRAYAAGERLPRVGRWVTSWLSPDVTG